MQKKTMRAALVVGGLVAATLIFADPYMGHSHFTTTSSAGRCDLENVETQECGNCYVRIEYTEICQEGGPQECGTVPYPGDPGATGGSGFVDAPSFCEWKSSFFGGGSCKCLK